MFDNYSKVFETYLGIFNHCVNFLLNKLVSLYPFLVLYYRDELCHAGSLWLHTG